MVPIWNSKESFVCTLSHPGKKPMRKNYQGRSHWFYSTCFFSLICIFVYLRKEKNSIHFLHLKKKLEWPTLVNKRLPTWFLDMKNALKISFSLSCNQRKWHFVNILMEREHYGKILTWLCSKISVLQWRLCPQFYIICVFYVCSDSSCTDWSRSREEE